MLNNGYGLTFITFCLNKCFTIYGIYNAHEKCS